MFTNELKVRVGVPVLALCLGVSGLAACSTAAAQQGPPPPGYGQQGYGQDRGGWDVPPQEWNEVQRRAFHEGVEEARRDSSNHRRMDADDHEQYRNPRVEPEMQQAYRDSFRRGYEVAMSHMGGAPMGGRDDERGWEAPPQEWNEVQRRGFHEGVEEARKDFAERRQPDADGHQEFRNPNVQPEMQGAYREAFRRGYETAMSHISGGPQGGMRMDEGGWEAPPQELNELQRRGYHDGVEGARKDNDNHRRPDVNNRDEYRNVRLPRQEREAYRDGFRRGYERAMSHLMGDGDRH